jgi:hypothetical protein
MEMNSIRGSGIASIANMTSIVNNVQRKYIRLPVNFHERIVTLENKLLSAQDISTITDLISLYKVSSN